MENKNTNENFRMALMKSLENPIDSANDYIYHKSNQYVESFLTENTALKEFVKNGVPFSQDWWICKNRNSYKLFAIHISTSRNNLDKYVAAELIKGGYNVIDIVVNNLTGNVFFTFMNENKQMSFEEVIAYFSLTFKGKGAATFEDDERKDITFDIIKWFFENCDILDFVCKEYIVNHFICSYFDFFQNLDVIWGRLNNDKIELFVGEIKFKSYTEGNVFYLNLGEYINYRELIKKTSFNVVALSYLSSKDVRDDVLRDMIDNKKVPMFYYSFIEQDFTKTESSFGNVSDQDKKTGKQNQKVEKFPFYKFKRFVHPKYIGGENKKKIEIINNAIKKNHVENKKEYTCAGADLKHLLKLYILYTMQENGFDVDFNDYITKDLINKNVLNIGGKNVLFKMLQKGRTKENGKLLVSQNLLMTADEINSASNIDYVVFYQEKYNDIELVEDKETGANIFPDNVPEDYIKIFGVVKKEDILDKFFVLKEGTYFNQNNMTFIENGKEPNCTNNFPTKVDTYFYHVGRDLNKILNPIEFKDNAIFDCGFAKNLLIQ